MNRLTELGSSAVRTVLERVGRGIGRYQERRPLEHDLLESDEEYLIVFDAPGVTKEDVQVQFSDDTVEVRLERFRPFHEGFEMRFPGRGLTLTGSATLPDDADITPAGATATLTDAGTLKVRIRKDPRAASVDVEDEADETTEE
ncbi:molecular chaperone Hsp20 [Halalkaliarchaeum desulfuricum]|uniref:Molecular chaperone Hsp20 n=1 Tax=Halalkaliarchaeum desulfuricum TaxID=2055893 RepID=A0A343TJZ3_9EURY|nr:Hsp20/alpha crystallin family protein [Halalkaliarchaeum desulfuricum]AUX09415.1 molecular chaperone Hsp20 [Halalkaliarchaeum desulfuricum]